MPVWSSAGYTLERGFDALTRRLRSRSGKRRALQVLPYIGYGNASSLFLHGRILRERKPVLATKENIWTNVLATYRRVHSIEIPFARIRASLGEDSIETVADEEGFFSTELRLDVSRFAEPVQTVLYEVMDTPGAIATGMVILPDASATFGIISDIDDTVVLSHATNLLRLAKTVFLQHARERIAFPGVAALYRALCHPAPGTGNPIFYVSSSPWNLYDLLVDFLELNSIPLGPLFLQDYGFDRAKFFSLPHVEHKTKQIAHILDTYPDLPFVLIGDSGQHDPEIYSEVLAGATNRIKAIYIRDVSGSRRDAEVQLLGERAAAHGGELVLVRDSVEAARHAARAGLISEAHLPEISADLRAEAHASPVED